MKILNRRFRRIAVPIVVVTAGVLAPTAASAHTSTAAGTPGDTLAAGGKAIAGGLGALCCLAVVAIIVVTVLAISRRRR